MVRLHLSAHDRRQLIAAISVGLHKAWGNLAVSEPQLVANMVWEFPKQVNAIKLSGTTKIKAGGIFIHAQPFVSCSSFPEPSPQSVEIGDLLLIRTLVVSGKVEERRALLLQAKKVKGIPAQPDNKNQWHLYEQWPRFTYAARSGGLTGKKRSIKEPDMYEAAKYLLIGTDSHQIYCKDWPFHWYWPEICMHHTAQPTKPEISRYKCFAGELVEFLVGNAGKVFDTPKPRTRGWNRVIQDLIDETAKAKTIFMGRATGGIAKTPRGSGALFCAVAEQADFFLVAGSKGNKTNNFNEPPEVPNEWGEDGDGGGISIIEFVVEQGEQ